MTLGRRLGHRVVRLALVLGVVASVAAVLTSPAQAAAPGRSPGPGFWTHHDAGGGTDVNACSYSVAAGRARCDVRVRTDSNALHPHAGASSTAGPDLSSGYSPAYLQSAYNAASATGGRGMTIAVVDAMDDPNAETDLAVYRSQFGLPPCTTANGCFRKVNETGGATMPAADAGWAAEISLDLDMASALCPNCHLLLVEASSDAMSDLGQSVNTAVALGANVVSNSYGGTEGSSETSYDRYYNHPGVAIVASAGDSGYGVQYPAASPYVTAVGGTSLYQASANGRRDATETAWSGTGSGCSHYEAKPSWQHDTGCARRSVVDVSAVADPSTGVLVYDSYQQNGFLIAGGTSAAAPIIGGLYALAGAPAAGTNVASYPYATQAAFTDVTAGSNGTCSVSYLCTAGPGYDGPTGLGTPGAAGAGLSTPAAAGTTGSAPTPQLGTYRPISPVRILDTRTGAAPNSSLNTALVPHSSVTVAVGGTGQPVPAGTSAVAVNVTVTGATSTGYLSVGPVVSPGTSNLNFGPGQTVANLVVSQVDADTITVYNGSSGYVDVIADVQGYYLPDSSGATYTGLAPVRILDTRLPAGTTANPTLSSPLAGRSAMTVHLGGLPQSTSAVALNVTVTGARSVGYLSVAPTESTGTSNLNFVAGQTVANLVLTETAGDTVVIYNGSADAVQVVADVEGYDASDGSGASYLPASPVRILDTRSGTTANPALSVPVPGRSSITVAISGADSPVPSTASAVALNVTVTGARSVGYLSVAPTESTGTSNLNFVAGQTVANLVLTETAGDTVVIYNGSADAVQVVADVEGYSP